MQYINDMLQLKMHHFTVHTYVKCATKIGLFSYNVDKLLSANQSVHAWKARENSHECHKLYSSYIQQHLKHTHVATLNVVFTTILPHYTHRSNWLMDYFVCC